MLLILKHFQHIPLKASFQLKTFLFVKNMSVNTRTLRSRVLVKTETSDVEETKGKLSKPKNVKPLKEINPSSRSKKSDKRKKEATAKSEKDLEGTVKIEITSDDEAGPISSKKHSKLELPAPKKSSISPRKRKQVKNEVVAVKIEKVIKIETSAQDIEDIVWKPNNWKEVLDNILKMRKLHIAPVDSLGCEECPDKGATPEVFRYQTLISVMLSSQTRDEVTHAATQRLIDHGLNVDSILQTSDEKIGELIYPAGFWKSKVKYIRNTTQILKDQYDGDIPRTFKDLCKLPGVGPKMANIVMSVAWNDTVGIAVDTHVHRISNRLGWVPKPTKEPEQTRKALESWLPKEIHAFKVENLLNVHVMCVPGSRELWKDASLDLVGFGQTICKPIKPKCQECLNSKLCPSSTNK